MNQREVWLLEVARLLDAGVQPPIFHERLRGWEAELREMSDEAVAQWVALLAELDRLQSPSSEVERVARSVGLLFRITMKFVVVKDRGGET